MAEIMELQGLPETYDVVETALALERERQALDEESCLLMVEWEELENRLKNLEERVVLSGR